MYVLTCVVVLAGDCREPALAQQVHRLRVPGGQVQSRAVEGLRAHAQRSCQRGGGGGRGGPAAAGGDSEPHSVHTGVVEGEVDEVNEGVVQGAGVIGCLVCNQLTD
jgi:hypothetical protein